MQNYKKTIGFLNLGFCLFCVGSAIFTVLWNKEALDEFEADGIIHNKYIILNDYPVHPMLVMLIGASVSGISGYALLKK